MSDPAIKYKAVMSRTRWRMMYIRVEVVTPLHKAAQRWLAAAAGEMYDVSEVKFKEGGELKAKDFELGKGDDIVTLELSRDAVLGLKYTITSALNGTGGPNVKPASLLERTELLQLCEGIGPDGAFKRLVEKDIKLPEGPEEDEEELLKDMSPPKEEKKEA